MAGVKTKVISGILDAGERTVKKYFTRVGRAEASLSRQGRKWKQAQDIVDSFGKNPKVVEAEQRIKNYRQFEDGVRKGIITEETGPLVNRGNGWEHVWQKAPTRPSDGDLLLASRAEAARRKAAVLREKIEKKVPQVAELRKKSVEAKAHKAAVDDGRKEAKRLADEIEGKGAHGLTYKVASLSLDKVLYPWKHWGEHKIRNSLAATTEAAVPVVLGSYAVNAYSTAANDAANDLEAERLKNMSGNDWARVTTDATVARAMSDTSYMRQYLYSVRDAMNHQYQIDRDWRKAEESARAAIDAVRGSDAWNRAVRDGVDSSLATVGTEDLDRYEDLYYQKFPDEESQILGERFWGRDE